MKKYLLGAAAALMTLPVTAHAGDPVKLSDVQMDQVSAGAIFFGSLAVAAAQGDLVAFASTTENVNGESDGTTDSVTGTVTAFSLGAGSNSGSAAGTAAGAEDENGTPLSNLIPAGAASQTFSCGTGFVSCNFSYSTFAFFNPS